MKRQSESSKRDDTSKKQQQQQPSSSSSSSSSPSSSSSSAGAGAGVRGGVVRPSDVLPNESPEEYMQRKSQEAVQSAQNSQQQLQALPGNQAAEKFALRQREIISTLQMMQTGRASRTERTLVALNQWKKPAVQIAFDCAGLTMFGDLREMSMGEMRGAMPWVFESHPQSPPNPEENRKKFIDCVEALIKETLADGINTATAIPRAIFQLGFDNNPLAVGGAIGANFLMRWAGWKLLTSIGEQLIGAISFHNLTLGQVVEGFQNVLMQPQENINAALSDLLGQFGVPEDLRQAYLASIAGYAYDQIQLGISTIAVTSISIAFGTNLLPYHNQFVDAAGNLLDPDLDPDGVLSQLLAAEAVVQGPLSGAANFTLELSRYLKRAFALLGNTSGRVVAQSILSMYGIVFFVRSTPGMGVFDKFLSIVTRVSAAAGTTLTGAAARVSPAEQQQFEAVKFVFGCVGLDLNNADGKNRARIAVFQSCTTHRMIKILNDVLKGTKNRREFDGLFLNYDCAKYLLDLIGIDSQGQLNMANLTTLFQRLGLLQSELTVENIAALSENFKSFSTKCSVVDGRSQDSMEAMQQIIDEAPSDFAYQAAEVFFEPVNGAIGEGLSGIGSLTGNGEETATPEQVLEREKRMASLLEYAAALPVEFARYLDKEVERGIMTHAEAAESKEEFGEHMNKCSTELVNAGTTRLATNAKDIADFVTESQRILKETSMSLSTKSKATVIAACGACVNFAAESANVMRRAGSAVGGWVRGFFTCVAPAVNEEQFNRVVVAAAAAAGGGGAPAAASAAAVAASVARGPHQDAVKVQLEMAAIAQSSLQSAGGGAAAVQGGVAGGDVDVMNRQGGRSRSRKRSASNRTRRRKGVAKKQKSKKNKRQSRRKVRRSSSRKVGRK
jgi:hypothetical protein